MDGIRISLCYGKRTTTCCDCISRCFTCSVGLARWKKNKVGCAVEERSAGVVETKCQEQVTERIQNNKSTEFEKSPANHAQENKTELFKASTYTEKQDDITSVLSEMVYSPAASPCLALTQKSPDQFCNRIEVQEKKRVRFCEDIETFDAPDYNRRFHKKHRTSIERATIKMELNKYKSEEMEIHPHSRIYTRYHHLDWRMFRRPDVEYYFDD